MRETSRKLIGPYFLTNLVEIVTEKLILFG